VPRRDDERAAQVRLPRARRDGQELLPVLGDPLERLHLLAQVHRGAPLEALLGAELDEVAAEDLRVAGDVVDVLLGVDRRHLAAELLDRVDDADGRVAVAGVVRGGEPRRARAEDRDVDDAVRPHWVEMVVGPSVHLACPRGGPTTRRS
jgi:hypothetical protein